LTKQIIDEAKTSLCRDSYRPSRSNCLAIRLPTV